ncbi:homeobox protein goosecoid-2 isoform X1 [Parus major]|uniref:homeobox protein goosecoid-2 isoform X1 n=1 Tax=Parus major TaxID=9157 RepID=UPI00077153E7|nr:homeobox protein goosecoid-2 isoform X1 [Parus major]
MSSEPASGADPSRRGLKKPRPFSIEDILSSPAKKNPQVLVPLYLQNMLDCTPKRLCELETIPASSLQEEEEEEEEEEELEGAGCNCCCCSHTSARSLQDLPGWLDARFTWPMQLFHPAVRVCKSSQKSSELQTFQQMQRRTRRHRTIFTEEQLQALETLFHQNQYPDVVTREHLANRIHLKEERVEVRFCHLVRGCWLQSPRNTDWGIVLSFLGGLQIHGLILKSILVHLTKESLSLASSGKYKPFQLG